MPGAAAGPLRPQLATPTPPTTPMTTPVPTPLLILVLLTLLPTLAAPPPPLPTPPPPAPADAALPSAAASHRKGTNESRQWLTEKYAVSIESTHLRPPSGETITHSPAAPLASTPSAAMNDSMRRVCGVPDGPWGQWEEPRGRRRRRGRRYALQGTRWRVRDIVYRISRYPDALPRGDVDRVIRQAFEVWAGPSDLRFHALPMDDEAENEVSTDAGDDGGGGGGGEATTVSTSQQPPKQDSKKQKVHIEVRWERGAHGDWDEFDGRGGTLGHANYPRYGGAVHLDADENWALDEFAAAQDRPSVLHIAAHEIGHALGLQHSNVTGAVMVPFYTFATPFRLHTDDVEAITALYGKAALPSMPCSCPRLDAAFATPDGTIYLVQGDSYYRHNGRRLDPAHPQPLNGTWPGLPAGGVDAAFVAKNGCTYFFKGGRYWRYQGFALMKGYPRLVKHGFPGVPDAVDAAVVWSGNGKLYFFKGSLFWKYDAARSPQVSPRYPKAVRSWVGLPEAGVDAALTYRGRTYFFSGEHYFRFNDTAFTVEEATPPFPRLSAQAWFRCRNYSATSADLGANAEDEDAVEDNEPP